ncbi:uncharacterized protein LOC119354174 isoform X3 [Triticum dicoccoides]|uniref:uncharacterized protein LOC119354174 isoform X3 n=1 Tax=Triticum dicoccoides TaxID=85692 RepID=UPI00188FDFF1|nr:uncharacterized protein LOC119354174 isoform X3 [Triticum dicoccoides]
MSGPSMTCWRAGAAEVTWPLRYGRTPTTPVCLASGDEVLGSSSVRLGPPCGHEVFVEMPQCCCTCVAVKEGRVYHTNRMLSFYAPDHRRLLDKLVLYGLVELKVNGDNNCQFGALSDPFYRTPEHHRFVWQQVVNQQHSRMYKKQSASVHARAPKKGSSGDADGRREVRGLDGVVSADVRRGEATAHHLPLVAQHTGCGARVRWLPPSAGGVARGRHRPGPA